MKKLDVYIIAIFAILIYFFIVVLCITLSVIGTSSDFLHFKWWVYPCFIIGLATLLLTPHVILGLYKIIGKFLRSNK